MATTDSFTASTTHTIHTRKPEGYTRVASVKSLVRQPNGQLALSRLCKQPSPTCAPTGALFVKEHSMLERFKQLVASYYNERVEKTDGKAITADDVYVVWSCKS